MANEIIVTVKDGTNGGKAAAVCMPVKANMTTHAINQAIEQANAARYNNDFKTRINYHPSGYYTA